MGIETIIPLTDLPPDQQWLDCVTWLFGHTDIHGARERIEHGGAYGDLLPTDPLQDGDIAFIFFRGNFWHVGQVKDGRIIGKATSRGGVQAGTVQDYRGAGYAVRAYRRNHTPFTRENNPFNSTPA